MAGILTRRWAAIAGAAVAFAAGCGRPERTPSSMQAGEPATMGGPQALMLRIARSGGPPRVHAYPRIDSVAWTATDPAPTPAEILAFDGESGSVAYVDTRGRPVLLDLRFGTIAVASGRKLTGLAAASGNAIYGIAGDGSIVRITPAGEWSFKPRQAAKALFPQPSGALLISTGTGANTRLLRVVPPEARILDSIPFPVATRTFRTQLGDRLYLAVDSGLAVFRTRTMDWAPAIPLPKPIVAMASTPSGDRVFALLDGGTEIAVIDRFREMVSSRFNMPGKTSDLRIDPFGRYVLARSAENDSIWVIAIGTERVIGGVRGTWRTDLPFVNYDGALAVAVGNDVVMYDSETLRQRSRIRGGAQDYWFPFQWDGFRPRSSALDEPVRFESVAVDSSRLDSIAAGASNVVADSAAATGFIVSFAAFLSEDRARELASRIHVGGENARVVTTMREGTTIYRVILGPFLSPEEADRAGRDSKQSYWVFEGLP